MCPPVVTDEAKHIKVRDVIVNITNNQYNSQMIEASSVERYQDESMSSSAFTGIVNLSKIVELKQEKQTQKWG
ncbi:hypothetical protein KSB_42430 [Ktedonobacter robiniae]|uniref:Uncharacterized protein n=1 Tax=Ktedonobacter robiniae TaxID=2778365 RepID=A0ABQ3USI3_9CHLR|nr:hypothetical protein KSB_42430 [Ktedonobacter robiniae]